MPDLTPAQVGERLQSAGPGALVYLLGAGGCGMSGLGHLLMDQGYRVAGSDLVCNEEVQQLRRRGARVFTGHASGQITATRPLLLVYSSAVRPDNAERVAAQRENIPAVRRAVLLAALLGQQRGICVAGMHGKTTTTAMLAYALDQLHVKSSYAIGAQVPQLTPQARFDREAEWFVIEADESDGTLLQFHPEHSIVLNVDEEHLDYYVNLKAVCGTFRKFVDQTRQLVVYCADDARLKEMLAGRPLSVSYGWQANADYRVVWPDGAAGAASLAGPAAVFEIWQGDVSLGQFTLRLLGEKNISNATAVIALLHRLGYDARAIARALESFRGARRRQQVLYSDENHCLVDDYGHHPREIAATLRAMKQMGRRRLLVAFQPHRYSRTKHLLPDFATCFREADRLWVTDVYAASETPIPGVNGVALAAAIHAQGQEVAYCPNLESLQTSVAAALQPGDAVLFLGAGDITHAAHQMAEELKERQKGRRARRAHSTMKTRPLASLDKGFWQPLAGQLAPQTGWRCGELLARHTTLRIGGRAEFWVEPVSEEDLARVLRFCLEHQVAFHVVGRGSNLLVRDGGIRGAVACLSHPFFGRVEVAEGRVFCGAGASLKSVVREAQQQGLSGLEFLEGIPGSVGGALRMNAGAQGVGLFEVLERVRFMAADGQAQEIEAHRIPVGYRSCPWFENRVALGAWLRAEPGVKSAIERTMSEYRERRWRSQPAEPNAGCIFKNPDAIPAGQLIDELGLKGTKVGGAMISRVHANFIVNQGQASAQDVLHLIELIRERARTDRGICLETEVEILGDNTAMETPQKVNRAV